MSVERPNPEWEVTKRVVRIANQTGGWTLEPRAAEKMPAWAQELVRQFNAAIPEVRECPHLLHDSTQPAKWISSIPDLLSCQRPTCEAVVVAIHAERVRLDPSLRPARCHACGRQAACRGVSVAAGTTLLRGSICEQCERG